MEPREALEIMCYTSERNWEGTVYTISDIRFPDYNGKKIIAVLKHGTVELEWLNGEV